MCPILIPVEDMSSRNQDNVSNAVFPVERHVFQSGYIGHIILIPRRHVVPLGQTALDTLS